MWPRDWPIAGHWFAGCRESKPLGRVDVACIDKKARSEIDLQRREGYPEISPQFIYRRQFQERAIGFPDVNSWGAGIVMEVPLHDRNQGNRARAASELVQADQELRAALVNLHAEISSLTSELAAARQGAWDGAEQLRLAEQVRDRLLRSCENGDCDHSDILEAHQESLEAYRNYINWLADYWRAAHRYNAALGRHVFQ